MSDEPDNDVVRRDALEVNDVAVPEVVSCDDTITDRWRARRFQAPVRRHGREHEPATRPVGDPGVRSAATAPSWPRDEVLAARVPYDPKDVPHEDTHLPGSQANWQKEMGLKEAEQ